MSRYNGYDLIASNKPMCKYFRDHNVECDKVETWLDPILHYEALMALQDPIAPAGILSRMVSKVLGKGLGYKGLDIIDSYTVGNIRAFTPCMQVFDYKVVDQIVTSTANRSELIETPWYILVGAKYKSNRCIIHFHGGGLLLLSPSLFVKSFQVITDIIRMPIYIIKYTKTLHVDSIITQLIVNVSHIPKHDNYIFMSDSSGATMIFWILLYPPMTRPDKIILIYPGFIEYYKYSPSKLFPSLLYYYTTPVSTVTTATMYDLAPTLLNDHGILKSLDITQICASRDIFIDGSLYFENISSCETVFMDYPHTILSNPLAIEAHTHIGNLIAQRLR